MDHKQLCQLYLNQLYQTQRQPSSSGSDQKRDPAATQGEILPESLNQLLAALSLGEQDVFFDLGAGSGQVTAQVFLSTPVKEACGIEFIPERHQQSLVIAQHIESDLPEFFANKRKLRFIYGNFLETSFTEATVVLMNSICFSQDTLAKITPCIEHNPNIHTVLSLRPLPGLRRLRFVKTMRTECSWDTALCYFYQTSV